MPELSEKMSFTLDTELGVVGMDVPDEVQVLPSGGVSPKGKTAFVVDEESRRMIAEAFEKSSTDLVVDYEHQSLSGSEAPAAGWIKELMDRGEQGIWAKVQWTERAVEYLRGREYRYLSPVVLIRKKDGRAVELLGAALTNLPAIDGMAPVVMSAAHAGMYAAPVKADDRFRELYSSVLGLIGLPEDAGLEEVAAKITSLASPEGFVPEAEHLALKDTLRAMEAEAMITEGLSRGKLAPSLLPWARAYAAEDPEGFMSYMRPIDHQIVQVQAIGETVPNKKFPPATMMLGNWKVFKAEEIIPSVAEIEAARKAVKK